MSLHAVGALVAEARRKNGITQRALAAQARVGLSTLDALENGRLGELGFTKVVHILAALGLELRILEVSGRRPTLEELMEEDRDDQSLDRSS